ncbi:hypothetical protein HCN51_20580 [Nonomuraea sp. FMUSA5-5]|uniref:Uncharacterized protein n=1 Tax=Nonomuraea composti TaxID=2720023 RepID=A0ABX1B392_9ACTN|nr:DUF6461 domain-containing protein [Nonomuraea sp. FMUSA5-5]NJP91826.1 hypothetical protein [Nonomuraea sp. FMUSA5-5]
MPADYAWEEAWEEIYTVTFVRGLDERETLRRFGVVDGNVHVVADEEVMERVEETGGRCDMVLVTRAGGWTIAFEYGGWEGTRPETLRELTRGGGEAVSVMRHDYAASHAFGHAADGRVRTAFRPQTPQERWGSHPDALNEDLRELGLDPDPEGEFPYLSGSVPKALALASRISGVLFTPALLEGPLLGGVITDAAPDDLREGDPLARHALRVIDRQLAEAIDHAPPDLRRRAAVAEARRQCELAGVADHPVLAAALASAERGETGPVGHDSPLAELIRGYESQLTGHPIDETTGEWLAGPFADPHRRPDVRRNIFSVDTATGMPACPSCRWHHRPGEAEREAVRPRWQAARSVRHALSPDARTAAYNTHFPLVHGDQLMADPDHAAAVAATLRATPT